MRKRRRSGKLINGAGIAIVRRAPRGYETKTMPEALKRRMVDATARKSDKQGRYKKQQIAA